MYHKPGEPLFYLPWQRGYRNPTGNTRVDLQPIGTYTPNEGDPLWEGPPDLDNPDDVVPKPRDWEEPDRSPDEGDSIDEVAGYVPIMPSKSLAHILVRPVANKKTSTQPKKGGIML